MALFPVPQVRHEPVHVPGAQQRRVVTAGGGIGLQERAQLDTRPARVRQGSAGAGALRRAQHAGHVVPQQVA